MKRFIHPVISLASMILAGSIAAGCGNDIVDAGDDQFVRPRVGAKFVYDGYLLDIDGSRRADTAWTVTEVVQAIDTTVGSRSGVTVIRGVDMESYYLRFMGDGDIEIPFPRSGAWFDFDTTNLWFIMAGRPDPVRGESLDEHPHKWLRLGFGTRTTLDVPEYVLHSRDSTASFHYRDRIEYIGDEFLLVGTQTVATRHLRITTTPRLVFGNEYSTGSTWTLDLWFAPSIGYFVKVEYRHPAFTSPAGHGMTLMYHEP